jgi:hypothetical protein
MAVAVAAPSAGAFAVTAGGLSPTPPRSCWRQAAQAHPALDHRVAGDGTATGWYERNLQRGLNDARWIEYSFSASLMIVLIAMLTGIADLRALIAIAGVNAAMILFGLVMEHTNLGRDRPGWLPFWCVCIAPRAQPRGEEGARVADLRRCSGSSPQ